MCHFWAQNGPFAPIFFVENINIIYIYLLTPFIVQNFTKILTADSVVMMCHFWAQNGPLAQMRFFFFFSENLLISNVPFIHVYLHTKNQSQILIY